MRLEAIPLNYLLNCLNLSIAPEDCQLQSLAGGSINHTFRLIAGEFVYFIKTNTRSAFPRMFELEVDGLETLRTTSSFRIPEVLELTDFEDQSIMVLEYIEEGIKGKDYWNEFGSKLAQLHRHTSQNFGYEKDNYIGSLRQANHPCSKWSDFFVMQRLEPQMRLAERYFSSADYRKFDKLFHRLDQLVTHEPPSLLHGDLWSGNYLVDGSGKTVLIDPAVYYGHREMDLAMMHLFGGFPAAVFDQYELDAPLQSNWKDRLDLHNLYPLLVHLNLFGEAYLQQLMSNLRKYL